MPLSVDNPALLVADMQEGLFSNVEQPLHQPDETLSSVLALVSRARSAAVPVIYTQFCGPPGGPLEAGSAEGEIHHTIAPRPGELVIRKDDSDAFLRTELHTTLQALGVESLIVCGLQSEFCVDSTCRAAYGHGYSVILVRDADTTGASAVLSAEQIIEHHNRTLATAYVTLCSADSLFV